MSKLLRIAPINSVVFVCPPRGSVPPIPPRAPEPMPMVISTPSCLMVCCYPEQDGETQITLGKGADVDPGYEPSFDGVLETPDGKINVEDVPGEILIESEASIPKTRVRVWLSDPKWPEEVRIGLN